METDIERRQKKQEKGKRESRRESRRESMKEILCTYVRTHTHTHLMFESPYGAYHSTDLPPSFRLLVPARTLNHRTTWSLKVLLLHTRQTSKLEQKYCLGVASRHWKEKEERKRIEERRGGREVEGVCEYICWNMDLLYRSVCCTVCTGTVPGSSSLMAECSSLSSSLTLVSINF